MGAKHSIAQYLLQSESTLPPHLRVANVATGYSQDLKVSFSKFRSKSSKKYFQFQFRGYKSKPAGKQEVKLKF